MENKAAQASVARYRVRRAGLDVSCGLLTESHTSGDEDEEDEEDDSDTKKEDEDDNENENENENEADADAAADDAEVVKPDPDGPPPKKKHDPRVLYQYADEELASMDRKTLDFNVNVIDRKPRQANRRDRLLTCA